MDKLVLIVSKDLEDYAMNIFSRHKIKIANVINWEEHAVNTKKTIAARILRFLKKNFRSLMKFSTVKRAGNLIVIGEDTENVINMLCSVILPNKNRKKPNIFIVTPFCVRTKLDFISDNNFDPRFVKQVPNSEEGLSIAENIMKQFAPSSSAAEKVFRTHDNIEAYESKNILVKIGASGLLGCTYTQDGTILNGCINGNRTVFYEQCINMIYSTEHDKIEVFDEEICPLLRVYSLWSYYHFLCEVLDKIIIAEELGFKGKYMLFKNVCADYLLSLLGIDESRIIWIDSSKFNKIFLLKNAFDIEGFVLNSGKSLSRLSEFADKAVIKFNDSLQYPEKIFISDEDLSQAPDGFVKLSPSNYYCSDMIKFFHHANIVMSDDMPVLANVLFMRKGCEVITKFPGNWENILADLISYRGVKCRVE